jgi:hypothetical protein
MEGPIKCLVMMQGYNLQEQVHVISGQAKLLIPVSFLLLPSENPIFVDKGNRQRVHGEE